MIAIMTVTITDLTKEGKDFAQTAIHYCAPSSCACQSDMEGVVLTCTCMNAQLNDKSVSSSYWGHNTNRSLRKIF